MNDLNTTIAQIFLGHNNHIRHQAHPHLLTLLQLKGHIRVMIPIRGFTPPVADKTSEVSMLYVAAVAVSGNAHHCGYRFILLDQGGNYFKDLTAFVAESQLLARAICIHFGNEQVVLEPVINGYHPNPYSNAQQPQQFGTGIDLRELVESLKDFDADKILEIIKHTSPDTTSHVCLKQLTPNVLDDFPVRNKVDTPISKEHITINVVNGIHITVPDPLLDLIYRIDLITRKYQVRKLSADGQIPDVLSTVLLGRIQALLAGSKGK